MKLRSIKILRVRISHRPWQRYAARRLAFSSAWKYLLPWTSHRMLVESYTVYMKALKK